MMIHESIFAAQIIYIVDNFLMQKRELRGVLALH